MSPKIFYGGILEITWKGWFPTSPRTAPFWSVFYTVGPSWPLFVVKGYTVKKKMTISIVNCWNYSNNSEMSTCWQTKDFLVLQLVSDCRSLFLRQKQKYSTTQQKQTKTITHEDLIPFFKELRYILRSSQRTWAFNSSELNCMVLILEIQKI